jgi:metal-responsive CopG/Arc/MetJ family transcriptional regulator
MVERSAHLAMKYKRFTISLPEAMAAAAERAQKAEHRTRSELFREALRVYLGQLRIEEATLEEIAAADQGKVEMAAGDYVTLDQVRDDVAELSTLADTISKKMGESRIVSTELSCQSDIL